MAEELDREKVQDGLGETCAGATSQGPSAPERFSTEQADPQVTEVREAPEAPLPDQSPHAQEQAPTVVQQSTQTSGLAVAALVLGIIAILGSFVPLLNLLTAPLAIVALVLGIIAKVTLRDANKSGDGLATAGLVMGIVALVLTVGMYGCMSAVSNSGKTNQSAQEQSTTTTDAAKEEADKKAAEDAKKQEEEQKKAEEERRKSEEEAAKKQEEAKAKETTAEGKAASGEVDPELKEMLDSYEAFMDEYIEFMNTYQNSDDTVAMLADYADIMARYSDYMQKVEAIDSDNLSPADSAYYIEVTSRVSQKLLTASS